MTVVEQSYRRRPLALVLLAFALFVVATNSFVIAGLLPAIATSLHTTAGSVSYSITSYSVVVAVVAPAVSILFPRVSRTVLMTIGLVVFVAGASVAVSATTLPMFFIGRTLTGLGGAAIVPVGIASAAALARPEERGRALGFVGAGFTLATAVGAPFGTAVGGHAGWRAPLWCLVGAAALLAIALPFTVRAVPLAPPTSLARRFAPLADPRMLAPLGASLLMIAGFNVVYIFSSAVTHDATGGSGSLLAALLLTYGVAGVVGNLVAGPVTDRIGSRPAAVVALSGQVGALLILPLVESSFTALVVVFAFWGVTAFAMSVPVQHRLVSVDPSAATLALSWYSTATYLGLAIAPPLGTAALALGGAVTIPLVGALVTAAALALFLAGYTSRRRPAAELA